MSSPPREVPAPPPSTHKTPTVGPVPIPTGVSGGHDASTESNSGTPAWLMEAKLRRQSRQPKMELSTPKQVRMGASERTSAHAVSSRKRWRIKMIVNCL